LLFAVKIALAEFDEAAVRTKDREPLVDRLARQRIEDDVDPLAAGHLADIVGEGERAGVDDVLHPKPSQQRPFFRRTRRREDFCPDRLRELDRGEAHPARGTVDQNAFALGQMRQMMQRIVDRDRGDRQGRGLGEAHRRRLMEQAKRRRGQM